MTFLSQESTYSPISAASGVPGVAGPPSDGDLLRVHRVLHDEVVRWRVGRLAGTPVLDIKPLLGAASQR